MATASPVLRVSRRERVVISLHAFQHHTRQQCEPCGRFLVKKECGGGVIPLSCKVRARQRAVMCAAGLVFVSVLWLSAQERVGVLSAVSRLPADLLRRPFKHQYRRRVRRLFVHIKNV